MIKIALGVYDTLEITIGAPIGYAVELIESRIKKWLASSAINLRIVP